MAEILYSPAKLNLGLKIVGRRRDGYHQLESLFWPITLTDEIEVAKLEENSTSRVFLTGPTPVSEETNLVSKILARIPKLAPHSISIKKSIPVGGGLGGGSSNAGTILKYFVDKQLVVSALAHQIAEEVGADVSFFLNPVPTWVTGIGENCAPLRMESRIFDALQFLVVPLTKAHSTGRVFEEFDGAPTPTGQTSPFPGSTLAELKMYLSTANNDLWNIAARNSMVQRVTATLSETNPLYCSVSGSGNTCFAVYDSLPKAETALREAKLAQLPDAAIYQTFTQPFCPTRR